MELEAAARELLVLADRDRGLADGEELAFFKWRGEIHLCRFHVPYPEKPYIMAIDKVAARMMSNLTAAVRRQRKLPTYNVHPSMDFRGWQYLLGMRGGFLTLLSAEDILYC